VNKLQELEDILTVLIQKRQEYSKTFQNIKVTPLNANIVNLEVQGEAQNLSINLDIPTLRQVVDYIDEVLLGEEINEC
jgi:hypothetical protein